MQLNGKLKLSQELQSKIGSVLPPKPQEIRQKILDAIQAGHNTTSALKEVTGFDTAIIAKEIDILNNLIVATHPGPPMPSYWLKSKLPKGRVRIENGRAVVLKENKTVIHNFKPANRIEPDSAAKTIDETRDSSASAEPVSEPVIDAPLVDPEIFADDEYRERMPVSLLDPHPANPRGSVNEDEESFSDLVNSIRTVGVQQPIVVTRTETERYRIVMGHRRHRAAIAAGLDFIRVIVRRFESISLEEDLMLIENIQRADLTPIQEAKSIKKVYERERSNLHHAARKLGLTQSYIAGRIKLLNLDVGIQIMLDRRELSLETGVILSTLDHRKQLKLLPRAQKMKSADLRVLARKMRESHEVKIPVTRQQKIREKRVTTDEERFTRTGALKSLDEMGDGAWISVARLKESFDDVCIDSCLESKDESVCNGCPVPRLIESLIRRKIRSEQ